MLCFFELKELGADPRSKLVEDRLLEADHQSDRAATSAVDVFPLQVVMWSLLSIGLWLLVLGGVSGEGRAVLFGCSMILILLAGGVRWWGLGSGGNGKNDSGVATRMLGSLLPRQSSKSRHCAVD